MNDSTTSELYETNRIEWTADKLRKRIVETRALIDRIDDQDSTDEDFAWIRALLARDLAIKETLLSNRAD